MSHSNNILALQERDKTFEPFYKDLQARLMACCSTEGFQRMSSKTTLEAPIRLIPSEQAFVDARSTLTSLLGNSDSSRIFFGFFRRASVEDSNSELEYEVASVNSLDLSHVLHMSATLTTSGSLSPPPHPPPPPPQQQ
ncbi:hypothetical protein H5410_043214 [Solanum commersonii]|uniref:Uncharacterized protein n=1 Tax=Solanum commersonii TaxID=4109 RepID=A0A9J5Y006_SOLCO|nr:hypothetical protein H5410_043214 [Solanum commersonii]